MRTRCAVVAFFGLLPAQVGRAQQPPAAPEPQAQSISGTVTGPVTGAVASVTGADVSNVPVDNLSNALQGRLAGVSVTQNAGTPGRESNIRVRAVGTFNGADPLYVIDGVVSDKFAFDGLNAGD